MNDDRNFNDPKYKAWRRRVYIRDKFKCRMPGCLGTDKHLNAHHIKKWATYPSLRFVVSNGITLCKTCHSNIYSREEEYESTFSGIVNVGTSDAAMSLLMMRFQKKKEDGKV